KVRAGAVDIDEAAPIADATPLADSLMIDAERSARVHTCLAALDEKQRENIREAFFGGKTYVELAEARDVPLGTMKSWIRRGLAKLKACLEAGE
ncbi:MAG: RNA polymerase subunit sigma, partial [Altererythrobacter sp.]|nr:RNA polymerase subunit sigma [Altererythrobacter sp.]